MSGFLFVVRLYFYGGSEQIKMVHSFIYDGDQKKDFIRSLGIRFDVPMREALYNRHIAFSCADGGVWSEPVQPLVGRRILTLNKTDNKKNSNEKKDAQQMPTDEPSCNSSKWKANVFRLMNLSMKRTALCSITGLHGMTTVCLNSLPMLSPFVNVPITIILG